MTAEDTGRKAASGVWVTLKKLKEQWVLVMFVAGTLIWVRDTYEQFSRLPIQIGEQAERLDGIGRRIGALEQRMSARVTETARPVLAFPGERHRIADAVAGNWTTVELRPVRFLRYGCRVARLDAFMVDSRAQWYSVETGLDPAPVLRGETALAFEVRVHPRMARGRASAVIQITLDCGSQRKVESTPRLPFRVLAN